MRLLLGNTLVFALGGLAVKAVSLVLMPLYTTALTAGEYGTAELLNSAIEIVLPLLSAGVVEALYRFSIDDDVPKDELFANSLLVLGGGGLCTGVLCALGSVLWNMEHAAAFFALFCSVCVFKATTQLARGLGHVRRFVAYGLINALAMVVSTYLLLVRAHTGIEGYLWSYTIGYLVGGLVAFLGSAEYRLLAPFRLDRALLRRMLVYSLPLVPYLFFYGCLAAALLFTFAYIVPKVRGIRGRSSREGTYYSLAWFLGMPLSALILGRVNAFLVALNTSQANEVASVVSNALPCLVVGVIFLMSAALWNEAVMGVLGGWILLVTLVVTIVGMPWAWWIMSVAGGGGMLVAAVVAAAAESKRGA